MSLGHFNITTTTPRDLVDITREVEHAVRNASVSAGVMYLFNPHTTAGLTINEGADPDVRRDIIKGLTHIVPENLGYRHAEGNSAAHIMTLLTGSSLTVFIEKGKLLLGTWQKIFFCEYDGPRTRTVHWKILADPQ
ncbi:MAG: hypothetical protein A2X81_03495 [Desulfobacterales bacterium GWB2_56_26]|nr:MAG: hypothetical protein A2X81_03495 [Desulfobacterales bacterium GWB2_56_26]